MEAEVGWARIRQELMQYQTWVEVPANCFLMQKSLCSLSTRVALLCPDSTELLDSAHISFLEPLSKFQKLRAVPLLAMAGAFPPQKETNVTSQGLFPLAGAHHTVPASLIFLLPGTHDTIDASLPCTTGSKGKMTYVSVCQQPSSWAFDYSY